ncbi:MAG TPA: hypothetical protein VHY91_18350 [Pirellulales bacterium]|jgi:hypothetical protein|nr:hypothetical protein [Pirellulales bacterium]
MVNPAVNAARLDDLRPMEGCVLERAHAYLHRSPYLPLRTLSCGLDQGVLTVGGCVPTFYLKQLAVAELMQRLCICEINDLIEVTLPGETARMRHGASLGLVRWQDGR